MLLDFNPWVNPYPSTRNTHYARNGMVATSQPLATQAGLDILKKGGNAIDAAIATAACLTVVEPTANGIGGDAFAIVWTQGKLHGLNSSGPAPASISIDGVKAQGHEKMPVHGWLPVTVPGIPGAWAALSKRFGKLTLEECLAPAIHYARHGYPLSPSLGRGWEAGFKFYSNNCKGEEFAPWFDTFAPNGRPPKIGEMWQSQAHAATLEEIGATNAESFYRGNLAKKIAAFAAKTGGYLQESDLAAFNPQWVDPISVNYRGYDVWEIPPNGQGLVALIALNILKGYPIGEAAQHFTAHEAAGAKAFARDAIGVYHKQFEAIKLAFACGKKAITDPDHMEIPVKDLLSDAFADTLRAQIKPQASEPVAILPPKGGTVYLATADGDGNMVSFIQSNYMGFGSGVVVPGTGIALQNRGADFSLDPSHANALAGGKRTYHTIIPGFLTKGGVPVGPFGVMGGYMQPQGHVQVIMNMIDFGLNPQAALDAPRWQWTQGINFDVEHHFPRHIAQGLAGLGHKINVPLESGSFGRGQIILRDPESGVLAGGTESRTDGAIAAW
ncbi:MAG: gamma-glutamyltransferase family protein [Defluviitaleaceae bacterium]|nr:gamma-glutamyltransferase family protein [Defluviitaleaceae bacterium]